MKDDVLVAILNRLENKVDNLSTGLATNTQITKSVEEQAKRTNGRVSKLEDESVDLKKISNEQARIVSRLEGSFKAHQQYIEEKIKSSRDFQYREINELKKYHSDEVNLDKSLKLEKEKGNTGKKLTIWGTISACILATLTWLLK